MGVESVSTSVQWVFLKLSIIRQNQSIVISALPVSNAGSSVQLVQLRPDGSCGFHESFLFYLSIFIASCESMTGCISI
jgi:hypothetical protein